MIDIVEAAYNGWDHCVIMRNKSVKLIVTTDVGPRIIYFGPVHKDINMFHVRPEQQGLSGSSEWMVYGGHRLWHSPQVGYRPNQPDNEKVDYALNGDTIELFCPEEKATKTQKRLKITMDQDRAQVFVHHTIINRGLWPIRLATWALSVMHEGGVEILPVPQEDTFFMPSYAISYWPWTKPNDPRFSMHEKYFILCHDPGNTEWFKIGYRNTEGWGAYLYAGYMFVKKYRLLPNEEYPDYGSSFETFTDNYMVELETLGPLKTIAAGECAEHTEEWRLFDNVAVPDSEEKIENTIARLIKDD
jgi:hypothetical protein